MIGVLRTVSALCGRTAEGWQKASATRVRESLIVFATSERSR